MHSAQLTWGSTPPEFRSFPRDGRWLVCVTFAWGVTEVLSDTFESSEDATAFIAQHGTGR